MPPPADAARRPRVPGWAWLTLAGLLAGVILAPLTCNRFDMVGCALPWTAATGGLRPWVVYRDPGCIYPPVIEYVLTAVRRAELILGLPADGMAGVVATKVPSLLAYAAGAWACGAGLAPAWGRRAAAGAAAAYALCVPVWYNAAAWGQWDAILTLPMVIAVVAVVQERLAWAGVALGVALAVKLQAVVIVPPLAVYALRQRGWAGVGRGVAGTAVGWAAAVGPMLAGGSLAWTGIRRAYAAPVDYFHFRTVMACNVWMVGETATAAARQWASSFGHGDDGLVLGPLTAKRLGLALLAADAAVLLGGVWLRPTARRFATATGLLGFGFFMLPTQMHERYAVPACGLLAVAAGGGRRQAWTFAAVTLPVAVNQAVAMTYENATGGGAAITMADIAPYQPWLLAISVVNVAVLVVTTAGFVLGVWREPAADPAPAAAAVTPTA